jgi:hypothetical protein
LCGLKVSLHLLAATGIHHVAGFPLVVLKRRPLVLFILYGMKRMPQMVARIPKRTVPHMSRSAIQFSTNSQLAVRSQLKKWLVPYLGTYAMGEIGGQAIPMFVQRCPWLRRAAVTWCSRFG